MQQPNIKLDRYLNKTSLDVLKEGLDRYIVRPANALGLGGFVFDVEGETSVTLESDITDHYVEDNSAIQDHWAVRPVRVTLRSYVGELVYRNERQPIEGLQRVVSKLTTVSSYLPQITDTAERIKSSIADGITFDDAVSNAVNLWDLTKDLNPSATEQQKAYLYFKALQQQRMVVSLQTPFEFLQNMAIESLVARQTEDTRDISDFSITLKQIRTASFVTVPFNAANYQSRNGQQRQEAEEKGKVQGRDTSILYEGVGELRKLFGK